MRVGTPPPCSARNHDVELGERPEEEACAICLATMDGEEDVVQQHLRCGHTFHHACISSWIRHQQSSARVGTCPVCRATAAPRECCERGWTELGLLSRHPHKGPTSETLVRSASANSRNGPKLYLLLLLVLLVVAVLIDRAFAGDRLPWADGNDSSSSSDGSTHLEMQLEMPIYYTYTYRGHT